MEGTRFETVAELYDRVRPGYPEPLLDSAFATAGIGPGAGVLEIGCGTGQLTGALVERGFRVRALDPGAGMLAAARRRVGGVELVHARFEDADLPRGAFDAVVSASAFHWVDPAVGWRKAADVLRPGGAIVLLTHMFVAGAVSADAAAKLRAVYARHTGAEWRLRTPDEVLAEAHARRDNVSAVWAVADGRPEVAEARRLFEPATVEALAWEARYSADELIAYQRTTATNLGLDEGRSAALEQELRALVQELGGVFPRTYLTLAAVARRVIG